MFDPLVTLPDAAPTSGSWIVIDDRLNVMTVESDRGTAVFPTGETSPVGGAPHLLGTQDGVPIWAVRGDASMIDEAAFGDAFEDAQWTHLRGLFGVLPDEEWVLAGRAAQVLTWDRDHQFCGRCGTKNEAHATDRAKVCPSCSLMSFPRLSPAVIMLVERDGPSGPEVLLAWGRAFPGRFFSALAGFVEPGESLEECVVREVKEECGIDVDDVRYFRSQPWPFPHSLMIGFTARYVSGDITIQEEEIVEAGWFSPNELPPVPRGGMSIAGWLIDDWLARLSAS